MFSLGHGSPVTTRRSRLAGHGSPIFLKTATALVGSLFRFFQSISPAVKLFHLILFHLLGTLCLSASAQTTAFTYQGRLNNGTNPASGNYDLTFTLFGTVNGAGQVGNTVTNSTAMTNGLFTVTLDFGNQFPGADRWLEIAVRTNGGVGFTPLSPRQPLTPTPYAVTAANFNGAISLAQLPTNVITNGASGLVLNGTFTGNFGGLTNTGGIGNRFTNSVFYDAARTASYLMVTNRTLLLPSNSSQTNSLCLYSVVDPLNTQLSSIGFLDGALVGSPAGRFSGLNWFPYHTGSEMELTIDSPGSMALGWANESLLGIGLQPNRSLQIGINPSEYGRLENIYIQGNFNSYANPNMGYAIPLSFNSAYKSNGVYINQLMTLWAHATTTNGESRLTLYDNWDQSATPDLKSHNFANSAVRAEFITKSATGMGGLDVYGRLWSTNFVGDGSGLTNLSFTGYTNAIPPTNTTVVRAWLNFTNAAGGVFKMPLYQ